MWECRALIFTVLFVEFQRAPKCHHPSPSTHCSNVEASHLSSAWRNELLVPAPQSCTVDWWIEQPTALICSSTNNWWQHPYSYQLAYQLVLGCQWLARTGNTNHQRRCNHQPLALIGQQGFSSWTRNQTPNKHPTNAIHQPKPQMYQWTDNW